MAFCTREKGIFDAMEARRLRIVRTQADFGFWSREVFGLRRRKSHSRSV
jgi:hypothetical protein